VLGCAALAPVLLAVLRPRRDENELRPDGETSPPVYFGDYPHGAYWSAERMSDAQEDAPADYSVSGPVLRLMWDYGVWIPLWDAEGLLPEEPEWLRDALCLSERLIDDLGRWGLDMNELDSAAPHRRTRKAFAALEVRGRELALRLQEEVGSRYTVEYRPWSRPAARRSGR
jgi:hypothetical protein